MGSQLLISHSSWIVLVGRGNFLYFFKAMKKCYKMDLVLVYTHVVGDEGTRKLLSLIV